MLVYLRKDETFAEISAGFAVSATTAWSSGSPLTQARRCAASSLRLHAITDADVRAFSRPSGRTPYAGFHAIGETIDVTGRVG
ncbi:MAG: hypothetical protein ACRDOO_25590 [Actinomadura sp.]